MRRGSSHKPVDEQENDNDEGHDAVKPSPVPAPPAMRLIDEIVEPNIVGRTPDEFVDSVTIYCRDPERMEDDDGKARFWVRCNGSDNAYPGKRCSKVWALPRSKRRIAEHVIKCLLQGDSAKDKAEKWASKKVPSANVHARGKQAAAASVPGSQSTSSKSPAITIPHLFSKKSDESYQKDVEAALVKVVCGLNIPPYSTDSKWWDDFITIVSCGRYNPISGTHLVESLIVNEAAYVREQTIHYLRSDEVHHITWGFCSITS